MIARALERLSPRAFEPWSARALESSIGLELKRELERSPVVLVSSSARAFEQLQNLMLHSFMMQDSCEEVS